MGQTNMINWYMAMKLVQVKNNDNKSILSSFAVNKALLKESSCHNDLSEKTVY